jgi:hypothetical protein
MSLLNDHIEMLIKQIQRINPQYKLDTLGFPKTIEGYNNLIRQLRVDRAVEFYKIKQEIRPLQVEVLRYLQEQTDIAYDIAIKEYDRGRLSIRLSREEAIGNYIDRIVRNHLKNFYNMKNIRTSSTGIIRIVGREYDTSQSESSYRIPDARVGDVAFDVSLTKKTLKTRQVEGFFNGDFKPSAVIIVRPSQLGQNNTYVIKRQGK